MCEADADSAAAEQKLYFTFFIILSFVFHSE